MSFTSSRRQSGRKRRRPPSVTPEMETAARCAALRPDTEDVVAVLGQGAFGRVVRQPFEGALRAVKYARDSDLLQEAAMMRRALADGRAAGYVARVIAACPLATSAAAALPYRMALVMEDLPGGGLYDMDVNGQLQSPLYAPGARSPTDTVAVRAATQLLAGLAYLHTAGVYHRDIKGPNLALTSHDPSTFVVKYIDFGLACAATDPDPANPAPCGLRQGTPRYMPPELFNEAAAHLLATQLRSREQLNRLMRGHDVWALGTTLACFASGRQLTPLKEVTVTVRLNGLEMARLQGNTLERAADDALRRQRRPALAGLYGLAAAMTRARPRDRLDPLPALEELKAFAPGAVADVLDELS